MAELPFDLIQGGGSRKGDFVCTWCGGRYETRERLENHWRTAVRCGRNKEVNNQTQEKNLFWEEPEITGEGGLGAEEDS